MFAVVRYDSTPYEAEFCGVPISVIQLHFNILKLSNIRSEPLNNFLGSRPSDSDPKP